MNRISLLLDTHIWLWWLLAHPRLRFSPIHQVIQEAEKDHRLRLSSISIWEAILLHEAGRIEMKGSIQQWLSEARLKFPVHVVPIDERIVLESRLLPGSFHQDPADRFIVATARTQDIFLATHDKRILEYSASGHVKAIDLNAKKRGDTPASPEHW
jgi:PIN domain nuclease of toxin-antitoxin system